MNIYSSGSLSVWAHNKGCHTAALLNIVNV
nr:MAG TPA: hypothetical protein [Caudoviricetes sp.]